MSIEKINNTFAFCIERIQKKGEDATPILLSKESKSILGVFDGLGGAGSKTYTFENQNKSGAALASQVVSNAVQTYLQKEFLDIEKRIGHTSSLVKLHDYIMECLHKLSLNSLEQSKSTIRSRLMSSFPTTLSVLMVSEHEDVVSVSSIWAGDSRNFILNFSGLIQLTRDDLKVPNDPLKNIYEDALLSNYVSLDKTFQLSMEHWAFATPCFLLSATDGCFQYVSSPMHFELLLLESLVVSNSMSEWGKAIETKLFTIAGDDYSMVMKAFPVQGSFESMKQKLAPRYNMLKQQLSSYDSLTHKFQALSQAQDELKEKLEDINNIRKENLEDLWGQYKKNYYQKFNEDA